MLHPRSPRTSIAAADVAAGAGLLAAAAVLALRFSGIGFLGWDAYPILAASRVASLQELAEVLTRPLAGGLLPMSFYRPLLSLTIALEWPLWGPRADGYVATSAALFGLCSLVLFQLLRRLGGSRPAALAAVLFFVLHPVVADVVPYLPRRPELLCTLCMLLALWLDHRGRFAPSRPSIAGAWLATAAAIAAKETAIALPLWIAAARWLFPAPGRPALRQAARGVAAHAAALAAVALPRLWALGGAGGYADTDVTRLPWLWPRTLAKTLLGVFLPEHTPQALAAAGLGALAAGLTVLAFRNARGDDRRRNALRRWLGSRRLRLAALAAVWILTLAAVYAAAARLSPWYLLIATAGAAAGFGVAVELALGALRTAAGRSAGVLALSGAALLLAAFAAGSPLIRPLEPFHQASRDSAAFLAALEERVRQTPAGGRIEAGPYPRLVVGADGRQVPMLLPRSLPGWAEVVFPGRALAFVAAGDPAAEPAPPGVTVVALGRGIHRRVESHE